MCVHVQWLVSISTVHSTCMLVMSFGYQMTIFMLDLPCMQGGGRYLFDVQCSGYLSVHPELPVTMWMEPVSGF